MYKQCQEKISNIAERRKKTIDTKLQHHDSIVLFYFIDDNKEMNAKLKRNKQLGRTKNHGLLHGKRFVIIFKM